MNPDVAEAIPEMVRSGILDEKAAVRLLRVARGELLSIHPELRLLFYLGVLLTATGVGLLVKDNYQNIGPLTVAIVIGVGALASFGWAVRQAPRFSWVETPSPSLSYDYLLLLGVLLASADLAFVEVQFTPLGDHWPWHLLITSCVMGAIAIRYDSRTIFSLALSTFAAWRGVSVSLIEKPIWHASDEIVRWNALACGLAFVFLGYVLVRTGRKAHFEPASVYLGWLLILGALLSGTMNSGSSENFYIVVLAVTSMALSWHSFRKQRFILFVFGVLGVYIALIEWAFKVRLGDVANLLLVGLLSVALMAALWMVHRKLKEAA
jgi:drug/metabolite transporter (DMT)-like permease